MGFFRPFILALAAASTINANSLHQFQQRSLIDVCANVDASLVILGIVFGKLDLCLCVSAIPQLLSTNLVLEAAVLVFGKSAVTAAVTSLIDGAGDHKQCHYPDHSVPFCSPSNPCDFTCKDGFTPSPPSYPTSCICKYPNTVCNGVCGYFPHCSSQRAKRDVSWRDTTCPHGWSACHIWGRRRLDFECVDVTADLWSCGGCEIPLLPTDPTGVDCTSIPNVHDVSCIAGRCVVKRCKDGFDVNADDSTCVPVARMNPTTPLLVHNEDGPFMT